MEKETNNSEGIKKYTREIRTLLENEGLLTLNELKQIHEKYVLGKDDLDKVEDLAIKLYEKAKSDFDFGSWDSALSNIEAAFYKSPFNIEILVLYCKTIIESRNFSEKKKEQIPLEPILLRLQQVDKREYTNIKKSIKESNNKSFNKLFLLFLLLLLIPIFLVLKENFIKDDIAISPKYNMERQLVNGEVPITIKNKTHPADLNINVVKSKLESGSRGFLYNLQFTISSEKENLLQVKGDIIWLNRSGNTIFSEPFIAGDTQEYFLNETIPVSYNKNSLSNNPDLFEVIIKINEIISLPGRLRPELKEIQYTIPNGKYRKLNFKQGEYIITEGVVSNYLSLTIILTNSDTTDISHLSCNILWYDDYDIVQTSNTLELISKDDIKLKMKESRTIHKTIELKGDITPNYKYEVVIIE